MTSVRFQPVVDMSTIEEDRYLLRLRQVHAETAKAIADRRAGGMSRAKLIAIYGADLVNAVLGEK